MSEIESVFHELRHFDPHPDFVAKANVSGRAAYDALCLEANTDFLGFWKRLAEKNLHWDKAFTETLDESNAPFYRWFADGELNVSYNCLEVNIEKGLGDKTAIIFESDDGKSTHVSYRALLAKVNRLANGLIALGVKAGDRVVIYLPMSVEGVVAMQACARIGATHSVVFGGFSAKSLQERIVDAGATVVITADYQVRGGKAIGLKSIVDDALLMDGTDKIQKVLIYQRTGAETSWVDGRDVWLHDVMDQASDQFVTQAFPAEHPLFILYTSGSTGKPKGVQHSSAGYLLWAKVTMPWVFDLKPDDIFWCTADIGWITGHTYIAYGPLANGATQIIFEGIPTFPTAGRFWETIAKHKATIFYTAPTAIRALIKASDLDETVHPKNFDLSSVRLLGTVGEPINPEAWMWYYHEVGKGVVPIIDTFWQTETGGQMISPMPGALAMTPGSCSLPLPGIHAAIVDETGHDLPNGHGGILVIKRPWPSMIRTIWGDPERFKTAYYPQDLGGSLYLAGDGAVRDVNTGYFTIIGRIDDVLNVSGHRMGSMEIESALVANSMVAEAAVVSKPDDLTGEAVVAFVVLKHARPTGDEAKRIAKELRDWISKEIGPIAKPKEIRFGDNLPKTRSGKIMRRLLRVLAKGEEITQDTSTLENPAILDQLKDAM